MIIEITKNNILHFTGIILAITGWLDGWKYHISASAIRKVKSAKGHSRRFINYAIQNDIVRLIHCLFIPDWYLVFSTILALIFMAEHFYTLYLFYPYKLRGCSNFKRPNIFLYLMNSIVSNRIRKKL